MDVHETLKSIGEKLQSAGNVKSVYGDPVIAGDRTVIPVARVRFGFGAGGKTLAGGGGGGGMRADPAGMIEITPLGSTFIAFPDYRQMGMAFAAGIVIGMFLFRRKRRT